MYFTFFLLIICLIVFTKVLSFRLLFLFFLVFYTCEGSRHLKVLDFFGRTTLLIFLMNIIAMNE